MTQKPIVLTAAILPDHRIVAKVNTRDAARAVDTNMMLSPGDELYDDALSFALSYVKLLDDGQIEIKAACVASDAASPNNSTRQKQVISSDSALYSKLQRLAGPLVTGKQVWID